MPRDAALLLVANHVSWWDGFLVRDVQRRLRPGAPLFTVMHEAQLARVPFFRWMGVEGVDPSSIASTRGLLRAVAGWRSRHGRALAVSLFPQGRIWPSSRRPLGFQRGIEAIAAALAPVAIVPIAIHLEPLTGVTPHAFVLIGEPIVQAEGAVPVARVEAAVAATLDRLLAFLHRAGEDAVREWRGERWRE